MPANLVPRGAVWTLPHCDAVSGSRTPHTPGCGAPGSVMGSPRISEGCHITWVTAWAGGRVWV